VSIQDFLAGRIFIINMWSRFKALRHSLEAVYSAITQV
jgi:hypothetical protein